MYRSILFVLLSTSTVSAAPVDSACLIEYKKAKEYSAGSGTVVACEGGKSLILSCAHVVPNNTGEVTVTLKGKKYKASYLFGSPVKDVIDPTGVKIGEQVDGVDLVLLVVDAKLPVVEVASEPVKEGDQIKQFGFAGGPKFAKDGPYAKIGKVIDPDAIWTTSDSRRGDSGCALLNAKDQLVGVVHSRSIDADEPGGMATTLSDVRKFLSERATGFPKLQKSLK